MNTLGKLGLVIGVLTLGGTTACEEPPDPAKIHRVKGSDHLSKKEWKPAIEAYELSLQADPKQDKVWEKKAFAHMQLGETDKAAEALQKLLEFKTEPKDKADLYRSLASLYMQGQQTDKAEQFFNEALKIEPKDEASLGWLAEIYSQRGGARSMAAPIVDEALQKSIAYYDQVIALNPNSANTYLNKRIVMAKYMEHERQQKQVAEIEAQENAKNKAKAAEAMARAVQHQTKLDELKVQFDELTKKFAEATKATKAAQAAGGAQQAAGGTK